MSLTSKIKNVIYNAFLRVDNLIYLHFLFEYVLYNVIKSIMLNKDLSFIYLLWCFPASTRVNRFYWSINWTFCYCHKKIHDLHFQKIKDFNIFQKWIFWTFIWELIMMKLKINFGRYNTKRNTKISKIIMCFITWWN